jgi:chitinase
MTTSTVYTTSIGTVTKCPATVINCPFGSVTTVVIPLYTTVSPVSVSATPTPTPIPSGENSGTLTTSTVYTTSVGTVTRCPVTVTNCPIGSLTTVIIPLYTTVCPVPEKPTAPAAVSTQPGGPILHVIVTGETTISAILTNLSPPTKTFTFNHSKYTTVPNQNPSGSNCPGCPPVTIVKTSTTVYTYPASSSSVKVVPPAVSTIIVYPTKPGNGTGVALPTTGGIVGTSSSTVIGGWKPSASVVSTASFVPVSGGSVFRVSRLMVLGMVGAIMM